MKLKFKSIHLYISKNLQKGFIIFPIPKYIDRTGETTPYSAQSTEKYQRFTKQL